VCFLRGRLNKGPYRGYKGKGYVIEVVIVTKKLLDSFKGQLRRSVEPAG
jgi:hypothetical protein